ncbi:pyridoxamine 5'-phosphate oxidase family protein [Chloroflexota bacterium]
MAKMPKEVMDLFNDPKADKVLATADADGDPNVVPKGSTIAVDEETIAFADIMGTKTNANLKLNKKVALVAVKASPDGPAGYQVKGTFQEFQASGPLLDNFIKIFEPMRLKPKAAGIIKVDEVYNCLPPKKIA